MRKLSYAKMKDHMLKMYCEQKAGVVDMFWNRFVQGIQLLGALSDLFALGCCHSLTAEACGLAF